MNIILIIINTNYDAVVLWLGASGFCVCRDVGRLQILEVFL